MKSLADLEAIRARTLENINMRKDEDAARVVIGMATCGIAAGARPVMLAFMDEIQKRNLQHVWYRALFPSTLLTVSRLWNTPSAPQTTNKRRKTQDGALSFSCAGLRRHRLYFIRICEAD